MIRKLSRTFAAIVGFGAICGAYAGAQYESHLAYLATLESLVSVLPWSVLAENGFVGSVTEMMESPLFWYAVIPLQYAILFICGAAALWLSAEIGGKLGARIATPIVVVGVFIYSVFCGLLPAATSEFGFAGFSQIVYAFVNILLGSIAGARIGAFAAGWLSDSGAETDEEKTNTEERDVKLSEVQSAIDELRAEVQGEESEAAEPALERGSPASERRVRRSPVRRVAFVVGVLAAVGSALGAVAGGAIGDFAGTGFQGAFESVFTPLLAAIDLGTLATPEVWLPTLIIYYLGLCFGAIVVVFIGKLLAGRRGAIIIAIPVAIIVVAGAAGLGAAPSVVGGSDFTQPGQQLWTVANLLLAALAGAATGACAGAIIRRDKAGIDEDTGS